MTVTWRQQIVAYCVLFIARMFEEDPALKQDLKSLSNRITTQQPAPVSAGTVQPVAARSSEFEITSIPT